MKKDTVSWNGKEVTSPALKKILIIVMTPIILTMDVFLIIPDKILKRCGRRGFYSKEHDKETGEETVVTNITWGAFKKCSRS